MDDKNMIADAIGEAAYYELLASVASDISGAALETARAIRKDNYVPRFSCNDDPKKVLKTYVEEFMSYAFCDRDFVPDEHSAELTITLANFLKNQTKWDAKLSNEERECRLKSIDSAFNKVMEKEKQASQNKKFQTDSFKGQYQYKLGTDPFADMLMLSIMQALKSTSKKKAPEPKPNTDSEWLKQMFADLFGDDDQNKEDK